MAAGRAMQQKECDESVGSLVVGKKEARTNHRYGLWLWGKAGLQSITSFVQVGRAPGR